MKTQKKREPRLCSFPCWECVPAFAPGLFAFLGIDKNSPLLNRVHSNNITQTSHELTETLKTLH